MRGPPLRPCRSPATKSYLTPPNKPCTVTPPCPCPCPVPLRHMPFLLPSPCPPPPPPPPRAKSCSLFRARLKCHPLWEAFPCPSSKENNHPSCWLPQPRTHSQECCGAESVTPSRSLRAIIYKMEASHLYLRGRVLEEFKKRRCKAPKHSADTQSVPNKRYVKLQVPPAEPAVGRKDVSGTFPLFYQLFSVGPQVPAQGYRRPTAHWKINND